jgi:hypothetical protein
MAFSREKAQLLLYFDFVSEVYGAPEAKEKVNVILYEFSNAFGTIYPPLLIKKLQNYGLGARVRKFSNKSGKVCRAKRTRQK